MYIPAIQLHDDEEIVTLVRRHWFSIAVKGVADVLIFIFFAFAMVFMDVLVSNAQSGAVVHQVLALGVYLLALVGLLLWMHFFAVWSDHWLDVWVLTNKRIIDIEQKGFFTRQVSSFPIERIQDVTYETSGLIATWLHFGNVRIQTASISDDLIMKQIPFPEEVKEQIVSVLGRG